MVLAVIWVGFSWVALAVCLLFYLIRMFSITAFYHRYFSHKSFSTSRPVQFLFALLGNCAVQRGPLWWASHHRHHHRHSDEEEDAHSPGWYGFIWSHLLWFLSNKNFKTKKEYVRDWQKYPELVFLDRFDLLMPVLSGVFMFAFGWLLGTFFPATGTSGMQMLVWGFFISTVLLFHATFTVNSLGHIWGRKRYETGDESRNNWFIAIITLGEGWHNNHHYYPISVRQGFYWWEIDISWYMLLLMKKLGLVWDFKGLPKRLDPS